MRVCVRVVVCRQLKEGAGHGEAARCGPEAMDGCVWYEDRGRRGGTEPSGGQGRSEAARTVVISLLRLLLLEASTVPSHLIHEVSSRPRARELLVFMPI